jgi:hypothetical protein
VYAKPKSHCIYYATAEPTSQALDILARYSSISTGIANNAAVDGNNTTRMGRTARGVADRGGTPEWYAYSIASEVSVLGFDYNGYKYSGSYGARGQRMTQADWLLRNAANDFYITYGPGDGTFLPDRGAWTSSTSYAVNDVVLNGGVYYKCLTANSDAVFTGGKWTNDLGNMAVNFLQGVLPNYSGESCVKYQAKHIHAIATRDMTGWSWAGVYLDSGIGYPDETIPLDWTNTGANQRLDATPSIRRTIDQTAIEYVAELKAVFGAGAKMIGNPNGGSLGIEVLQTEGIGALLCDGNLHESAVAPSVNWSAICTDGVSGGGNSVMESGWALKTTAVRNTSDHRSVLGVKGSTANDYRTIRLGIAVALMQGGRAALSSSFDGDYTATVPLWADEWDQALGSPIDAVQALPFSGQIFKRRFQNGVVLLNQSKSANLNLAPQSGLNRGVWSSGVSYGQHDHVTYNDGTDRRYICRTGQAHTSGVFATDFAAGRWHRMTNTSIPNFVAGASVTIDSSVIPYGIYKRFSGTQDPAHNSGAVVNGPFQLGGWDAILLLCVTPGVHS